MSDSSINFSSLGAFSFHWNQGIDRNHRLIVRLGSSVVGFFKALFCGCTVDKVDVLSAFKGTDHINSIFANEYRKKMPNLSIEKTNSTASEIPKINVLSNEEKGTNDEEKNHEKNNDKKEIDNANESEFFKSKKNDLTELDRNNVETIPVVELEELMESKDFDIDNENFSEDKLSFLKPDDCLRLFRSAVAGSHIDIALRLLTIKNLGNLVNASDNEKIEFLSFFIEHDRSRVVEYFMANGIVDVNSRDAEGNTFMMLSAMLDRPGCLNELLGHGANANDGDPTPLYTAVMCGNEKSVQVLLRSEKVDVNFKTECGNTALHCAAQQGYVEILNMLLDHGANVNEKNSSGFTALHWLAFMGRDAGCLEALQRKGIDIDAVDKNGDTAFSLASRGGNQVLIDGIATMDRK